MIEVIGVTTVLVGVVAAIIAYRQLRQGRRRKVRVTYVTKRLTPKRFDLENLQIRFRGSNVEFANPYTIALEIAVRTRYDVTPADFNDQPLRIDFGVPVVSLLSVDGHPLSNTYSNAWHTMHYTKSPGTPRRPLVVLPAHLDIPAALLSTRQPWTITALCDKQPIPTLGTELTNVDFVLVNRIERRLKRFLILAAAAGTIASAVYGFIAGWNGNGMFSE